MKSITFSEKELDFLRKQYQVELEEAEEYVKNIRNILDKVGSSENMAVPEPKVQEPKKRGRKPKVVIEKVSQPVEKIRKKPGRKPKVKIEEPVKEIKKRGRKPTIKKEEPVITEEKKVKKTRSDKGKKRLKKVLEKPVQPPTESETDKMFLSKKKVVKKKRNRRHGVVLTPMSKSFRIKEPEETPTTTETPDTSTETSPDKVE